MRKSINLIFIKNESKKENIKFITLNPQDKISFDFVFSSENLVNFNEIFKINLTIPEANSEDQFNEQHIFLCIGKRNYFLYNYKDHVRIVTKNKFDINAMELDGYSGPGSLGLIIDINSKLKGVEVK